MRVLSDQAANQLFICIMEYLTIPTDVWSLTAHTQTGDESDCNVTALQRFTEGCKSGASSTVWSCTHFQNMGIRKMQTGNAFDDSIQICFPDTASTGNGGQRRFGYDASILLLNLPQQTD